MKEREMAKHASSIGRVEEEGLVEFFTEVFPNTVTLESDEEGRFECFCALKWYEEYLVDDNNEIHLFHATMRDSQESAIWWTMEALIKGIGNIPMVHDDGVYRDPKVWWISSPSNFTPEGDRLADQLQLLCRSLREEIGDPIGAAMAESDPDNPYAPRNPRAQKKVGAQKVSEAAPIFKKFVEEVFRVRYTAAKEYFDDPKWKEMRAWKDSRRGLKA